MFTTINYGKSEQKQPSEAIQRCFADIQGKEVALLVIARAKATSEEGDQLREALERSGVNIGDWEDFMNTSDG
ncbi:MAG: hypothetical protein EON58_19225 [Alphaproteobacteria bacterium]|nr:MAG: hypothetical protein EON58_19225 [Alphaproteobacteria bacterium]